MANQMTKQPTYAELQAQIAALQAKLAHKSTITFKISEKGAVSVYGLGRFPVTLYGEQWNRLLRKADDLNTFLLVNRDKLSVKGSPVESASSASA